MNKILLAGIFVAVMFSCKADQTAKNVQPVVHNCANLELDLQNGTLNGEKPTLSLDEVKQRFPCYTDETEEGSNFNCGGGVFYLKHDFFFYTHRDYLEVRKKFPGKVIPDILNKDVETAMKELGKPDLVKKEGELLLYKMPYGTLRLKVSASNTIIVLGIHAQKINKINLCE
ncbi:MAG: hypothetical protein N2167_02510 [Flavobacteriales bacterium]|nr:hypothetical protein [Flavobacteriales bacterium]